MRHVPAGLCKFLQFCGLRRRDWRRGAAGASGACFLGVIDCIMPAGIRGSLTAVRGTLPPRAHDSIGIWPGLIKNFGLVIVKFPAVMRRGLHGRQSMPLAGIARKSFPFAGATSLCHCESPLNAHQTSTVGLPAQRPTPL